MAGNLDVAIATARLREARATVRLTSAQNQLPKVNVTGEFTKAGTSQENPQVPKLDNRTGVSNGPSPLIPIQYGVYQAYFDASFEIDLFGSVRHAVRANRAEAQSSEDNLRDKLVSTVGEVGRDYILLRQYQQEIANTQSSLQAYQDTLHLTQVRHRAGLVTDLDVIRAQSEVAATQAGLPLLEVSQKKVIHALAVLIGQSPETLYAELMTGAVISSSRTEIAVGLPSDLLRRRPDIRKAERSLAASTERVGVQVANLFPRITLTAQYGGQTGQVQNLFDSAARYFSYGPQISWGLLNYPAARQDLEVYRARESQAYQEYRKTVLTAFQDVDDSLVAYNAERERELRLQDEVAQNQKAFEVARNKYSHGLTDFLNVLDSQRSLLRAEDTLIDSQAAVSTNLIAFYKAVGGGWELNDPAFKAAFDRP